MAAGSFPNDPLPRSSLIEVAIAVIKKGGQYLISQRLSNDSFGGMWEFPGGKAQTGEAFEACLIREIQEELGIIIAVGQKLQVIEHRYSNRTIRLHCYACTILSGEPKAIECSAWRWINPDELAQFQFPPASGPLIQAIMTSSSENQTKSE